MTFNPEPSRTITPIDIGQIAITLIDDPAEGPGAVFDLVIEYDIGPDSARSGNLAPHLEGNEQQQLLDFMAVLRARAETQILGV
jgi:hypothetical protein